MTQKPNTPAIKKVYKPKRTVGSLQTSFMLGIMRAKGYVAQDYILRVITSLSSVSNFSDMTFDEARYFVMRLPNVSREKLDAFMAGEATQSEIGLPPYKPLHAAFGKRNDKGGKA